MLCNSFHQVRWYTIPNPFFNLIIRTYPLESVRRISERLKYTEFLHIKFSVFFVMDQLWFSCDCWTWFIGSYPKTFVMENVSGMIKGNMKIIFKDILTQLKASGYDVRAKLMNAQYYNCPTSRQRMIFIGVRKDLGIPASHPKPTSKPITVREAIGHLENKIKPNNSSITRYAHYLKPGQKSGDLPHFPTKTRDIYRV